MIVELGTAAATSDVRRAVLRPAWPPGSPMPGDDDPDALHLAARDEDGRVIGAAVLLARPAPDAVLGELGAGEPASPAWQLRGMAVVESSRGRGVGAAVLHRAVELAAERGVRLVWCEARERAEPFYARNGYRPVGELYPHAHTGAPHRLMIRPVSASRSHA